MIAMVDNEQIALIAMLTMIHVDTNDCGDDNDRY